MANKYLVIKQGTWEHIADGQAETTPSAMVRAIEESRVDDAFVLRLQDQLATGALYAYASSVLTAIELIEAQAAPGTMQDELDNLREIHDAAFDWAERAKATQGKLPS